MVSLPYFHTVPLASSLLPLCALSSPTFPSCTESLTHIHIVFVCSLLHRLRRRGSRSCCLRQSSKHSSSVSLRRGSERAAKTAGRSPSECKLHILPHTLLSGFDRFASLPCLSSLFSFAFTSPGLCTIQICSLTPLASSLPPSHDIRSICDSMSLFLARGIAPSRVQLCRPLVCAT